MVLPVWIAVSSTVDHVFNVASIGKQVTGLGVMMLSEEGKVRYDAPVGDYVHELAHFGPDFTVRSLLTHTSGLLDYDYFFDDLMDLSDRPTNADLVARAGQSIRTAQCSW